MHKINKDTAQILSYIQEKYSKIGAKVFYPPASACPNSFSSGNEVLRVLSLLKLSGNAVFISEPKDKGRELVNQVLFCLSKDKINISAIQLDIEALTTADKKQAGFNFQNIIQYLQAYEGKVVLFITALGKVLEEESIISALYKGVEQKSIPILSVIDMKEFHKLEEVPKLSGLLQFILTEKNHVLHKRDKSVLIIGASSLFGNTVYRSFCRQYQNVRGTGFSKASSFGFDKLDVTCEEEIKAYFTKYPHFDIIIYIAGEANADIAEKERDKAHMLNVDAVSNIARYIKNCKFVYISSEYVFDGSSGPYGSSSGANPINYYGCTKLEGEKVSLKNFPDALIVRLGALYGYNGPYDKETTVSKLIASLDKPQALKADNVQIKHPLLLEDAAGTLLKLLDYGVSGVYQTNGPEGLNKQEMAERIAAIKNELTGGSFSYPIIGVKQTAVAAKPLNTHMVNVDTPRPFDEGIRILLTGKQT
ncbi:MAG: sugar nucleotide-binding protein [Candidatus Omnitrophota bacterium]|nr:sugar nucleotide-binding protein [Candidatus Omnitrophota bacterium]